MPILTVGPLATLGIDIKQHKPESIVILAPNELRAAMPSFLLRNKRIRLVDIKEPFGMTPTCDRSAVGAFLEAGAGALSGNCHIACPRGNGISMAAAYVMLCLTAKIGQEANAAVYLRFEAAHGEIDRSFVAIADELVERGGGMVRGLQEMLPANLDAASKPVRFDLDLISMSMAS